MNFTTDFDFNYSKSRKVNRRPLVLISEVLLLEIATCTSSENEADDEKSDYEKRIEENKRSLREEVEWAMDNVELEVYYFDHDHVRYLALFPWLLHFYGNKRVRKTGKAFIHHVSGCQMDIGRKEHIFKS